MEVFNAKGDRGSTDEEDRGSDAAEDRGSDAEEDSWGCGEPVAAASVHLRLEIKLGGVRCVLDLLPAALTPKMSNTTAEHEHGIEVHRDMTPETFEPELREGIRQSRLPKPSSCVVVGAAAAPFSPDLTSLFNVSDLEEAVEVQRRHDARSPADVTNLLDPHELEAARSIQQRHDASLSSTTFHLSAQLARRSLPRAGRGGRGSVRYRNGEGSLPAHLGEEKAVLVLSDLPGEILALIVASLPSPWEVLYLSRTCMLFSMYGPDNAPTPHGVSLRMAAGRCDNDAEKLGVAEGCLTVQRVASEISPGSYRIPTLCMGGTMMTVIDDESRPKSWGSDLRRRGFGSVDPSESCLLGQGPNAWQCRVPRHVSFDHRIDLVACSSAHTLAASRHGLVWSWGIGGNGQLGHGDDANRSVPTIVETIQRFHEITGVQSLAAGGRHSVVVTCNGWCWSVHTFGCNANGQLGHGHFGPSILFPTEVLAVSSSGVRKCAAGTRHTLLSTFSGAVFSFGAGDTGQLGGCGSDDPDDPGMPIQNSSHPRLIPLFEPMCVRSIGCGCLHTLIVVEGGDLYTFGSGGSGQLGHGDLEMLQFPRRVEPLVGVPIMAVAAGSQHSLALTRNGRIFAFGFGEHGALGGGDYVSSSCPQLVTTLIHQRVTEIAAGGDSSSSRNRAGLLWTWGRNSSLTLGHSNGVEPTRRRLCTPTLVRIIPEWSGGDVPELVPLNLLRQPHSSGY